jgi:hypothetical protein
LATARSVEWQGTRFASFDRCAAPKLGPRYLNFFLTSPGFVAVSSGAIDDLQNTLGCEKVITAETEAETILKDCFWHSSVSKKCLKNRRASAALKSASGSELKAVSTIAYCNNLPVTMRGGATVATSFT